MTQPKAWHIVGAQYTDSLFLDPFIFLERGAALIHLSPLTRRRLPTHTLLRAPAWGCKALGKSLASFLRWWLSSLTEPRGQTGPRKQKYFQKQESKTTELPIK